ncbi:MAG: hypothetical protein CMI90_03225 [Pelagibacteraceae bacterium]|nr:hypothetical protein [Pelagibacteraceae bacterium]|tara:strand:+ start:503 stop:1054 length:552 start_codon:yes stop_codon:yes gene_type:complete
MSREIPLFVDLDGTIIREDIGNIALREKINKNIFSIFVIIFKFFVYGIPGAKYYVSKNYAINLDNLTFNKACLNFINEEKLKGRKIYLISGSHIILINQFKNKLFNFNDFYGTHNNFNMISNNKVKYIRKQLHIKEFDYIGNSNQDLAVWKNSNKIIYTNTSDDLVKKINLIKKEKIFIKEIF